MQRENCGHCSHPPYHGKNKTHEPTHLRHVSQLNRVQYQEYRCWLVPDGASDMIYMNHNADSTGEPDNSQSQLNFALEKSISGCCAMNLQRQMSESQTRKHVLKARCSQS